MKEKVRIEASKFFYVGIIYYTLDSVHNSSVQVVPKKKRYNSGTKWEEWINSHHNCYGIEVCIDSKLNIATWKDHFSILFIDKMLERLIGHSN